MHRYLYLNRKNGKEYFATECAGNRYGDIGQKRVGTQNGNVERRGAQKDLMQGPMGTEHDMPFIENLYISSAERRALENLQKGHARTSVSKCLPRTFIEEKLERMLQVNVEAGLNMFRDKARNIAAELGMEVEFDALNSIIGALLSTKPSGVLSSASAIVQKTNGYIYL